MLAGALSTADKDLIKVDANHLASNQVVGSSNLSGRAIKSKACEIAGLFYGLHRS